MGDTTIQWTDKTWNPVRGCSRVSEGCRKCYAERTAARFAKLGKGAVGVPRPTGGTQPSAPAKCEPQAQTGTAPFRGFVRISNGHPQWTGKVELIESKLDEPLHWRKPARVFVNSMSDLFHEALPDEAIDRVFAVMALCPQHTFQILTKRASRLFDYASNREMRRRLGLAILDLVNKSGYTGPVPFVERPDSTADNPRWWATWPLPNVWLGVSVEYQKTADERIPLLLETPAAIRFVSYEPALGPVNFNRIPLPPFGPALDWVIVGGESGPGARPFNIAWARNTIMQCKIAGVACFVKQLGAKPYVQPGGGHSGCEHWLELNDRKGGDPEEWSPDLRVREFPT